MTGVGAGRHGDLPDNSQAIDRTNVLNWHRSCDTPGTIPRTRNRRDAVKKTLVITLATLGATGALAQTATTTPPAGRLLASNCFQCHGTDGKGDGTFEKLAGKSSGEIYKELVEMRAENKRGEIMTIHALGYTDAQLRAIADYFSRQR